MISSSREERQSVSHRSAAPTAIPAAPSPNAMRTTADFLGLLAYLFLMRGWALDDD